MTITRFREWELIQRRFSSLLTDYLTRGLQIPAAESTARLSCPAGGNAEMLRLHLLTQLLRSGCSHSAQGTHQGQQLSATDRAEPPTTEGRGHKPRKLQEGGTSTWAWLGLHTWKRSAAPASCYSQTCPEHYPSLCSQKSTG